jgi:lysophospholipase L1-like esterase
MKFPLAVPVIALALFACFTSVSNAQDIERNAKPSATLEADFTLPATDEGLPGAGPIRRYEWFQKLWSTKRAKWAGEVKDKQGALVFLGDSITQGWGDGMRGSFGDTLVANRGISGDTTRGMLIRLQKDVLDLNPSGVVMLMGTNDLEEGADPQTIADNLALIIDKIHAHNSKTPIVLSLVFPSSESKKRPAEKIQEINRLYQMKVKGDAGVHVVDTWTLFANEKKDAKVEEFPDLLHPNEAGYKKWRSALRPILEVIGLVSPETEPAASTQAINEAGFESLFNGKDLTGWGFRPTTADERKSRERWQSRDPNAPAWPVIEEAKSFDGKPASDDHRYIAVNNRLVVTNPPEGRRIQQLWTTRDFNSDYVLKLEFRATPNADSGIFVRGKQLQCRDFVLAGPYKELKNYKPQEWNQVEIIVTGNTARYQCNGEVLEEAFSVPPRGPIGLEGDRGQIEYRNIRIQPLGLSKN